MAAKIVKPQSFGPEGQRQRQIEQVERLIKDFAEQEEFMADYLAEQLLHELRKDK